MERTTAPSLTAIRSNALATALALALGVSTGVAAAPVSPQQSPGLDVSGSDAATQMRRWLANHPQIAKSRPHAVRGAITHHVTTCLDDGSAGTLRSKVAIAASGDYIDMSDLSCSLISLNGHLLVGQETLRFTGDGTTVITNIAPGDGLVEHLGQGLVSFSSLTLSSGVWEGTLGREAGGCILSHGEVQLWSSTLENCKAINHGGYATGGAVFADGGVFMSHSVISGSEVVAEDGTAAAGVASGGAIYTIGDLTMKYSAVENNEATGEWVSQAGAVWAQGNTFISRSTISSNSAQNVGGLVVTSSVPGTNIKILNSTIALNVSSGHPTLDVCGAGAFLRTPGDVTLENSTITGNSSFDPLGPDGGGAGVCVDDTVDTITLNSNILSGNKYWDATPQVHASDLFLGNADPTGGITIQGTDNLVGNIDTSGASYASSGMIRDTITPPIDAFGDHGGPTKTLALSTGSWAFNLGQFTPESTIDPSTDQRGMTREVGAGVDIGAFESDALFIGRFEDPPISL